MSKKLIYFVSFVLLLSMAGNASADLILHWRFDEGSGTTAYDSSGNGRDGTFEGDPKWVAGKVGGALDFGGTGDLVVDEDGPNYLNGLDAVTVCIWIKSDVAPTDKGFIICEQPDGGDNIITMRYDSSGATGGGTSLLKMAVVAPGDEQQLESSSNLQVTEWQHVCMVWSRGEQLKFYVNGVLDTPQANGAPRDVSTADVTTLIVGQGGKDAGGGWDGLIDDVRIYDEALTEPEIQAAMKGEAYPYALGPVPEDGVLYEDTWANISWSPGDFAVSHDVYLGDNFDDVNAGAESTFLGNQATTSFIVGFPGFPYPDGLVPGTTYYWRIDEVNDTDPNSPWKGNVWSFTIPPYTAYDPDPADGVKFVPPDAELNWTAGFGAKLHYVYFGDNFDDVNSGVVGLPQGTTSYTPGTLELDKVYYWRIDEFDAVTTHKGDVWSFSTIPDIAITDPSLVGWWKLDEGMGTTAVDWSGHGNHGTFVGDPQWVAGYDGDALEFDGSGDWVTTGLMPADFGIDGGNAKTVTAWVYTRSFNSGGIYDMGSQSDGQEFCLRTMTTTNLWRIQFWGSPPNFDLDFTYPTLNQWAHLALTYDGTTAQIYADGTYLDSFTPVLNTANAAFVIGRYGSGTGFNGIIDNVRLYNKALTVEEILLAMRGDPLLAGLPKPSNGSTPYIRDATPLNWSPGDNASQHDVYFGTDKEAVADADASDTTGIYRGRQGVTIYTPPEGVEWGGGPYYWRVDEYNTDATISKGYVWSFTVADFIGIDDIEDYNDYPPDEIFSTWIDGWEVPTNGSMAGHADPPFAETTIVHGGGQSMPLYYDNNFMYSEATMTLVWPRDWTEEGVGVLSLWFYGDAANAAERMYVNLNGIATVYNDNPDAALIEEWTEWPIDLQEFAAQGVNLANVNTISIGFGDKNSLQAGGSGMVFFDDIRLYRPAPEPEP